MSERKVIFFLQHGDFAEAYEGIQKGCAETYRDQHASVNFVATLSKKHNVIVVSFGQNESRSNISDTLTAIVINKKSINKSDIEKVFDEFAPTHVVLRTPHSGFIKECKKRKLFALPIFADMFTNGGLRSWINNYRLRRLLSGVDAPCYSNHSLNASLSMHKVLKLPKNMILPWDWSKVPVEVEPKQGIHNAQIINGFFAGMLIQDKGVEDCITAVKILRDRGIDFRMSFAGPGDKDFWRRYATDLGVESCVRFYGKISNADVRALMRDNDFVIVPSRHTYPEGLPNTIYEGLASRSVLIISDHPAFRDRLVPDQECIVFAAGRPQALADAIQRVHCDQGLYRTISLNAEAAHAKLYVGLEWAEVVGRFVDDPRNSQGWVESNCLSAII